MASGPSILVRVLGDVKGLTDSLTGVGTHTSTVTSGMKTAFSGVLSTMNQTGAFGPLTESLSGILTAVDTITEHAKGIGTALLGAGAAVTGVGAGLSAFGSKDQAAQQQLQTAIEATGGSYDDYAAQIEAAIGHQEAFGHTADETQTALQTLTQATHDPARALELLATASDLAAAKHEDLGTAAGQVGKVYNGSGKILKEFGITLDKSKDKTVAAHDATDQLGKMLAGQASAGADTFKGKMDAIKATVEDQVAVFGQKWGPTIQTVGLAMTGLGATITIATGIIGGMSKAYDTLAISEGIALGPMVLLILAFLLIIATIVILYAKWDEFWNWAAHLPWYAKIALAIALISNPVVDLILVVSLLAVYWSDIWGGIAKVVSWVWNNILHPAFNDIATVVVWMAGIIGKALSFVVGFVDDWLVHPFERAWEIIRPIVDKIVDAFGKLKDLWDKLGLGGPPPPGGGHAPPGTIAAAAGYQHGGIVTRPTLALIGEAGPEAVIPLHQFGTIDGGARTGPVVNIEHATFAQEMDVDLLMRRVAWAAQTRRT